MPGARRARRRLSGALALAAIALLIPSAASAASHVTIVVLPNGTTVERLGAVDGISPGLLSAGLGEVPPQQTMLDVTQGNRVYDGLYDTDLPALRPERDRISHWAAVRSRAASAPAEIHPGLLATIIRRGDGGVGEAPGAVGSSPGAIAILGADRDGRIERAPCRTRASCPALTIRAASLAGLARLIDGLRGGDLLIAFERPAGTQRELLAAGIAGRGFDGNLTSDSTRTSGYVVSTDIAPTVLERLGLGVPGAMSGQPITTEGSPDAGAVASLEDRLGVVGSRRGPVLGLTVLAWLVATGLVILVSRRRLARPVLRILSLTIVYLPVLLLVGAALRPSAGGERLVLGLGAPLLAGVTAAALRGWWGLAVACAVTVVAYAADAVAGSTLISQSLLGPNPALGVRFFGIGNELEAILGPLVVGGTGAALAALGVRPGRTAALLFLATGAFFGLIFGSGRFGADVGAVIVLMTGGAVAAMAAGWWRPSRAAAIAVVVLIPIGGVVVLAAIDLLTGGNAHLTRTVLHGQGSGDVLDVVQRRARQTVTSFGRLGLLPFLLASLAICGVAIRRRERVLALFGDGPARAGFIGAVAAMAIGVLANDSGAVLLEIGTAYLLAFCAYAWATLSR